MTLLTLGAIVIAQLALLFLLSKDHVSRNIVAAWLVSYHVFPIYIDISYNPGLHWVFTAMAVITACAAWISMRYLKFGLTCVLAMIVMPLFALTLESAVTYSTILYSVSYYIMYPCELAAIVLSMGWRFDLARAGHFITGLGSSILGYRKSSI